MSFSREKCQPDKWTAKKKVGLSIKYWKEVIYQVVKVYSSHMIQQLFEG